MSRPCPEFVVDETTHELRPCGNIIGDDSDHCRAKHHSSSSSPAGIQVSGAPVPAAAGVAGIDTLMQRRPLLVRCGNQQVPFARFRKVRELRNGAGVFEYREQREHPVSPGKALMEIQMGRRTPRWPPRDVHEALHLAAVVETDSGPVLIGYLEKDNVGHVGGYGWIGDPRSRRIPLSDGAWMARVAEVDAGSVGS